MLLELRSIGRLAARRDSSMSLHDKTLQIVTNLDRAAIEARLGDVRQAAAAAQLTELAKLFVGIEGMPRAQIEQRVGNALKWLAAKPEQRAITAQLELVELNLPNLK
jgi:hypothetical protein